MYVLCLSVCLFVTKKRQILCEISHNQRPGIILWMLIITMDLSLCHKLKFSNPYVFPT